MPRQIHDFPAPDRFVAGTVGQPGERTFFLQARAGARVVSVALEKAQVAVLSEKLVELVDEVRKRGIEVAPPGRALEDVAPLDQPIDEEFRAASLTLTWVPPDDDEPGSGRVVVEARAIWEEDADVTDDEGPETLRVSITPEAALGFARRADRVVAAGRPPCPLCGLPLDPEGHVCPRQNGHRH